MKQPFFSCEVGEKETLTKEKRRHLIGIMMACVVYDTMKDILREREDLK